MNKVLISYFYQIRNFSRNMIPISTACSDPKWYHINNDKQSIYLDRRGILNGLREDRLAPGSTCYGLCNGPSHCKNDPSSCEFIKNYSEQLSHINFKEFERDMDKLISDAEHMLGIPDPMLVFIVYEAPDNPCSERQSLINWFKSNGVEIREFYKK